MTKEDSPSTDGKGRLLMRMDKKWGNICNTGFTDISANVACKQLGFSGGTMLKKGEEIYGGCKLGEDDFCKPGEDTVLENVKCKETDTTLD